MFGRVHVISKFQGRRLTNFMHFRNSDGRFLRLCICEMIGLVFKVLKMLFLPFDVVFPWTKASPVPLDRGRRVHVHRALPDPLHLQDVLPHLQRLPARGSETKRGAQRPRSPVNEGETRN